MRLWHKDLIPALPKQQLLGQWRECCLIAKNIKEKGTPNHLLVNRIMDYPSEDFYSYCILVILEMACRKYNTDWEKVNGLNTFKSDDIVPYEQIFFDWHTPRYFWQCYYNLQEKYDCGSITEKEWEEIEKVADELKKKLLKKSI